MYNARQSVEKRFIIWNHHGVLSRDRVGSGESVDVTSVTGSQPILLNVSRKFVELISAVTGVRIIQFQSNCGFDWDQRQLFTQLSFANSLDI